MELIDGVLWGLLGGLAVEGLQFIADGRQSRGWPWKGDGNPGKAFYLTAIAIRLGIGGIVAGALADSQQVSTAIAAVLAGVAAPLIVQKAAAQSVLDETPEIEAATTQLSQEIEILRNQLRDARASTAEGGDGS